MQYKIPQNVGIEDKIVGPLTLRQLIILAVGFGISYVLFAILSKLYELNILEYAVIILPGLLAAAFALIKVNDVPLTKFVFLFLEFTLKPKRRVWDHRGIASLVAPDLSQEPTQAIPEGEVGKKAKTAANLTELTRMLDSGGFEHIKEVQHADMDKTKDDDLVTEAYFGNKRDQSETKNMYWRTKDSQLKRLELLASLPVTELKKGTKETAIAQEQILNAKNEAEKNRKTSIENNNTTRETVIPQKPKQAEVLTKQYTPKPQAVQPVKQNPVSQPKPQAVQPVNPVKQNPVSQPKPQAVQPVNPVKQNPVSQPKPQAVQPVNPVKQNPASKPKPQSAKPDLTAKEQVAPVQTKNTGGTPEKPIQATSGQTTMEKKKPRKRNRPIPQPVRDNNQINTTNKSEPAKYISNKPANKPAGAQIKEPNAGTKGGEFDFRELEKGEIEINLD